MRSKALWVLAAVCLGLAFVGFLPRIPSVQAADPWTVLREGERLVYQVTWMGIRAGQATLESEGLTTYHGQPAYHLVTTAKSSPLISKFYPVEDRNESYVTVTPMRTLFFEKNLREGRYRHSSQTVFDQAARAAIHRYLDFSNVPKGVSRLEEAERYGRYVEQDFPLAPGALDELSVLYYVRTLPLQEGRVLTAKVFASRKNWDLEVRVLHRETLDTVLGRRDTLVVEPLLAFEGIFQQKGRMVVWLTNDAERVPVQMKSEIKVGSFVSTLLRRETGRAEARAGEPGRAP